MIDVGTVTGVEIAPNKDGDADVRLLQVEFSNPDDLQTIEHYRSPGDDSAPRVGDRVIVLDIGPAYRVAIAFDESVVPSATGGNKTIYSWDDSDPPAKMAWINLNDDETIEIANASGSIAIAADGTITLTAGGGTTTLDGSSGQFDANGNFTVDK